MPDLEHTLQGYDLSFLKMIAGLWGLEMNAPDAHTALPDLVKAILHSGVVQEVVESLPPAAIQSLRDLVESEGHLPWSLFARRYGEIRPMGAARRERERPDLHPATPSEVLWYRGLIGRTFFNLPPEPQEYAYIPDDLLELFHLPAGSGVRILGHPASPAECAFEIPAGDRILDRACTLLAARRIDLAEEQLLCQGWDLTPRELEALLAAAGLLDKRRHPQLTPVREFLEAPRAQALSQLANTWRTSRQFNELRLLPGLLFEGDWANDPFLTRRTLLDMLAPLPQNTWWSLDSFVAGVKENQPDFQRPAGDYDSWFIRREGGGEYLRGFASWDEVDGALVRYLVCGPLHWLGVFDLAAPDEGAAPAAFRPSPWASSLLTGDLPKGLPAEEAQVRVNTEGLIAVPRLAPRAVRYQLARFGDWLPETADEYRYRITPQALARARAQELKVGHLTALLHKNTADPLPPLLVQALKRWEKDGVQASLEPAVLLRLSSAGILPALRKTRAARFILEELSPTVVKVKPGSEEAILRILAEIGYLGESRLNGE